MKVVINYRQSTACTVGNVPRSIARTRMDELDGNITAIIELYKCSRSPVKRVKDGRLYGMVSNCWLKDLTCNVYFTVKTKAVVSNKMKYFLFLIDCLICATNASYLTRNIIKLQLKRLFHCLNPSRLIQP